MSTPGFRNAIPILFLALFGAFFFRAVVGSDDCFFHTDFHQTFEPLAVSYEAVAAKGSARWNPQIANGSTILGNPIYSPLAPARRLLLLLPPARALTWSAIAHIVLAAVGTYALGLTLGLSVSAATLAALVFGFCGSTVSTISTTSFLWTSTWMPWVLRGVLRTRDAPPSAAPRALLSLALPLFLLVAGGAPCVIAATALGALALVAFTPKSPTTRAFRVVMRYGIALLLVMIVAAPALVATFRYFPVSVRAAGFKTEGVLQWSLHPLATLGLVLSDPFGDPNAYGPGAWWGDALEPGRRGFWVHGLYVGALALALATLGACAREARHRIALVVWLALSVLLALGRYGPFYGWIVELPFGSSLRYPIKWLVAGMLPIALLAGSGLDQLRTATQRAKLILIGWLVALGGLNVGTYAGLDRYLASLATQPSAALLAIVRDRLLTSILATLVPLAAAAVAIAIAPRFRGSHHHLPMLVAMLVAVDLTLANPHLAPSVPASFYRETPAAARIILDDPRGRGRTHVEAWSGQAFATTPPDVASYFAWERQRLYALTGASYGLDLAFNLDVDSQTPFSYAELGLLATGAPLRELAMVLGTAGATHVVTHRPLEHVSFELMAELPDRLVEPIRIYRNHLAVPRARVVRSLTAYRDLDGLIQTIANAPDDFFFRTALVASSAPTTPLPPRARGTADIREDRGDFLRVGVEGEGGFLVLSDSFVPGWTAAVDGRSTDIVRADHTFRAVAIPAGEHEVVMRYDPW